MSPQAGTLRSAVRAVMGIVDAPKALLPLWLVAIIAVAATAAGTGAAELGVPALAAVAIAAVASWVPALLTRVGLARRGRAGFQDMPSADLDYNDSGSVQTAARLLNTAAWFGAGFAASALVGAAGLSAEGDVWLFPADLVIGVVSAYPALTEADGGGDAAPLRVACPQVAGELRRVSGIEVEAYLA
jgi:hypothetical protein